jgi:hypothetical protein
MHLHFSSIQSFDQTSNDFAGLLPWDCFSTGKQLSIVAEIEASDLVRPLNAVNLVGRCLNLLYRGLTIGVIRY